MRCSLDRSRDSNLLKSIRTITSQKRYPLETKFLKEFLAIIAIRGSKMGKPSQVSKTQARQFQRQVLQSKFVSQIKGHIRVSKLVTTLKTSSNLIDLRKVQQWLDHLPTRDSRELYQTCSTLPNEGSNSALCTMITQNQGLLQEFRLKINNNGYLEVDTGHLFRIQWLNNRRQIRTSGSESSRENCHNYQYNPVTR